MLNWYIDSSRREKNYLDVVNRTVEPFMNYFCDRVSEIEDYDLDDLNSIFKDIVDELPILTFESNRYYIEEGSFIIRYNACTIIKLNDPLRSIKREILLNKILA